MAQKQGKSSTAGGRLDGSLADTAVAANFVLGAGWGGAATIAVTTGSTDQRGQITITASTTTPAQATATVVHTFAGGAWAAIPWPQMSVTTDQAIDEGRIKVTSRTTTAATWTYSVLPVDTKIYIIDYCYTQ